MSEQVEVMQHEEGSPQDAENEASKEDSKSLSDAENSESEKEEEEEEEEETKTQDQRLLLKDAFEEHGVLLRINKELHQRVLRFWASEEASRKEMMNHSMEGEEQLRLQYMKLLSQVTQISEDLSAQRISIEAKIEKYHAKLDSFDEKAAQLSDALRLFKREIAEGSIFSRSGKVIKPKRMRAFEALEQEKDKEVEAVRLRNIHYQNQLDKLEAELKQKEELADGLHLIDFEQLKIENQTLNEKIEERNDELHKLRKKTTQTVQVLTHIKEKLKFVKGQNALLHQDLAALEDQVTNLRDKLTKAKHIRDRLREENVTLKNKRGFIGSDLLVTDYERRKIELQELEVEINSLKQKHSKLVSIAEAGSRPSTHRTQ